MKTLKQIYLKILSEQSAMDKAEAIALHTHFWQTRRNDDSYFKHLLRTVKRAIGLGYGSDIQVIALLHDAIEDSINPAKTKELIKKSFPNGSEILQQIEYITHAEGQDYTNYVHNVWKKSPQIAFKVKMLDMWDNLNDNPSPRQFEKYKKAIQNLLDSGVPKNVIPKQILNKLQLVTEAPADDAKKLGLWHIGYGKYVALGDNNQANLVAISRKGVLKFIGKDKEKWTNKFNQINS